MIGPPFRPYRDILRWRLLEEPNRHFTSCFDMDGDGVVTRGEFTQDTYRIREELFRGLPFSRLDHDRDGKITQADFSLANRYRHLRLIHALQQDPPDEAVAASILGPGESGSWAASLLILTRTNSMRRLLQAVQQPLFVIHGSDDRRIPASETRLLQTLRMDKIRIHIEGGHDHELNWGSYAASGRLPRGIFILFRTIFVTSGLNKPENPLHDQ